MKLTALLSLILVSTMTFAQTTDRVLPKFSFDYYTPPAAPDYSNPDHWAALPSLEDEADKTPKGLSDRQEDAPADVFFVHPTTYTGNSEYQNQWNGSIHNPELVKKTDKTSIRYQASIFNSAGKIYAPRYRQAHIYSYFSDDRESALMAFELAYQDVKKAFEYYLEHYNNGRPIIIASHSQGATHSTRLVKEFFDGTPLQEQLIAAYLVGMPVEKTAFEHIVPCETEEQTNCFCSWRTFAQGYSPKMKFYTPWHQFDKSNVAITNPLTWSTDTTLAGYDLNHGGVLKKFNRIRENVIDAQIHKGLLWVNRPKVFGARLVKIQNFHVGDLNLFYVNVRENAALRVRNFLGITKHDPGLIGIGKD